MRCLSLAEGFAQCGWQCGFIFRSGTLEVVPWLERTGYDLFQVDGPMGAEPDGMKRHWADGCDLLVVDHYGWNADHEKLCRGWAKTILVIDDLANRPHDCDVLVDQNLGEKAQAHLKLVPHACKLLVGPKYALVRRRFAEARSSSLARRSNLDRIQRVLINFGLTDPFGMTQRASKTIANVGGHVEIDIVGSSPAVDAGGLVGRSIDLPDNIHVYPPTEDMPELMTLADVAVGAAGVSSWERCCLGLPGMVITVAENQEANACELERLGAVIFLGIHDTTTIERLQREFRALMADPERLRSMSRAASQVCDGRGALRILMDAMPSGLARDGKSVRLRFADAEDANTVYLWQKDPRTRRFARNPNTPGYREHMEWFERKLHDADSYMMLILHEGMPAGVLRLDRHRGSKEYEISILVSPEKYRTGLGKAALKFADRLWPSHELVAEVLESNVASRRLFQSAGFVETDSNRYVRRAIISE